MNERLTTRREIRRRYRFFLIARRSASKLLDFASGTIRRAVAVAEKSKQACYLAVAECLARCYVTDLPVTCLAQFCAELRQKGWCREDVYDVESTVRRLLAGVMGQERESLPDFDAIDCRSAIPTDGAQAIYHKF